MTLQALGALTVIVAQSSDQDLGKQVDKAVPDRLGFADWLQAGITVAVALALALLAHRLVMRLAEPTGPDGRGRLDAAFVPDAAKVPRSATLSAPLHRQRR